MSRKTTSPSYLQWLELSKIDITPLPLQLPKIPNPPLRPEEVKVEATTIVMISSVEVPRLKSSISDLSEFDLLFRPMVILGIVLTVFLLLCVTASACSANLSIASLFLIVPSVCALAQFGLELLIASSAKCRLNLFWELFLGMYYPFAYYLRGQFKQSCLKGFAELAESAGRYKLSTACFRQQAARLRPLSLVPEQTYVDENLVLSLVYGNESQRAIEYAQQCIFYAEFMVTRMRNDTTLAYLTASLRAAALVLEITGSFDQALNLNRRAYETGKHLPVQSWGYLVGFLCAGESLTKQARYAEAALILSSYVKAAGSGSMRPSSKMLRSAYLHLALSTAHTGDIEMAYQYLKKVSKCDDISLLGRIEVSRFQSALAEAEGRPDLATSILIERFEKEKLKPGSILYVRLMTSISNVAMANSDEKYLFAPPVISVVETLQADVQISEAQCQAQISTNSVRKVFQSFYPALNADFQAEKAKILYLLTPG